MRQHFCKTLNSMKMAIRRTLCIHFNRIFCMIRSLYSFAMQHKQLPYIETFTSITKYPSAFCELIYLFALNCTLKFRILFHKLTSPVFMITVNPNTTGSFRENNLKGLKYVLFETSGIFGICSRLAK